MKEEEKKKGVSLLAIQSHNLGKAKKNFFRKTLQVSRFNEGEFKKKKEDKK